MGVAAYNRGSRLISRQLEIQVDNQRAIIDRLNAITPRDGAPAPFQAGVIRFDESTKTWWIMNNESKGWASFGFAAKRLDKFFANYRLYATGFGRDGTSLFLRFEPRDSYPNNGPTAILRGRGLP